MHHYHYLGNIYSRMFWHYFPNFVETPNENVFQYYIHSDAVHHSDFVLQYYIFITHRGFVLKLLYIEWTILYVKGVLLWQESVCSFWQVNNSLWVDIRTLWLEPYVGQQERLIQLTRSCHGSTLLYSIRHNWAVIIYNT